MSHAHLEVIFPKVENVEDAVAKIMSEFNENQDDRWMAGKYGFWDWYVIGGRWSGQKIMCMVDPVKLESYVAELVARKVTVHGLQAGKQEIHPVDQIPMVDKLWCDMFPEIAHIAKCYPQFKHFNNQYESSSRYPDVMSLKDVPKSLEAERVIIASFDFDPESKTWSNKTKFDAQYMIARAEWNGVSHIDTVWDGKIETAVKMHADRINEKVRDQLVPNDDWLCVTVDYHT